MTRLRSVAREPLVHFFAGAALIFGLAKSLDDAPPEPEEGFVIHVDEPALVRMLMAQRGVYDAAAARSALTEMDASEREAVIARFVREEALYREARRLGLDREDYVVRRRLGQSVEWMARGLAEASAGIDEAALRARYDAAPDRYRLPPTRSLTQIFFAVQGDATASRARAQAALDASTERELTPADGDRAPTDARFESITERSLHSHLGPALATRVFELPLGDAWHGPFETTFGLHLIQVDGEQPGPVAPFADVRNAIEEDLRREAEATEGDGAVRALIDQYEIVVELDGLGSGAAAQQARPPTEGAATR